MPNNNTYNNNISADRTLIGFLAKARNKKVQKRIISLLSVVVLLVTLNQTKQIADTLQRIPMCGIAEHMHDEVCVNEAGEYICGLEEHAHTDACYQQRPMDIEEAVEAEVLETHALEAPVAETSVELSDEGEIAEPAPTVDDEAVVSGDVEEIPSETVVELGEDEEATDEALTPAAMPLETEESSPVFDFEGRDYVALSEILPVLPLQMEEVVDVLAVLDEDQETSPIIIEKVEQDYTIYVIERFAWTDIAVETEDGLKTITLIDGGTREEDLRLQTEEISVAAEETAEGAEVQSDGGSEEQTVGTDAEGEEQTVAALTEDEEQTMVMPTEEEDEQAVAALTEDEEEQDGEGQSDEEATDEGIDDHTDGDEEGDTSVAVEGAEDAEQTGESAVEDGADESEVEDETEESKAEGDGAADEVQEPQPQVVADGFHTVIDLSEVEVLPLSLREIVGKMEAEQSLIEQSIVEPAVTEETDASQPEVIEEQIAEDAQFFDDQAADERPLDAQDADNQLEALSTENIESMNVEPAAEEVVVELGEEQAEDRHDDTVVAKAAVDETVIDETIVDYDSALLSLTPIMEGETVTDYSIDVIADFDSTDIIVDGQYTITLLNGVNPCPAQSFIASTEYMNVSVTADAGAFPAGTAMEVSDVVDDDTISGIADSVTGHFVEVERVHAVDICFKDAEGREIEPRIPISVVMTVKDQIEEDRETVVVHMDNEGEASVVEAAPVEPETESAEEEAATVAFTSDSFSVYAVVVTRKLETNVLASDGENYKIEVTYGPDAGIPDGAVLAVSEVTEDEEYRAQVEAGLAGNKMITLARFFDIKIMESAAEDAAEVHPAEAVEVRVWLEDDAPAELPGEEPAAEDTPEAEGAEAEPDHIVTVGEPVACAAHFAGEEDVVVVDAAEDAREAVVFTAEGFSVWGVVYTVDFYYGNYEWHMDGGGCMSLSGLVDVLNIAEDARAFVASVDAVEFSTPELLAVVPVNEDATVGAIRERLGIESQYSGRLTEEDIAEIEAAVISAPDWALMSLKSFESEESLSIVLRDGRKYEIRITDPPQYYFTLLTNDAQDKVYFHGSNSSNNPNPSNLAAAQSDGRLIYNYTATFVENSGYEFAYWLKDDDTTPSGYTGGRDLSGNNTIDRDTTFIAFVVPAGEHIIRLEWQNGSGSVGYQGNMAPRSVNVSTNNNAYFMYCYSNDDVTLTATPDPGNLFVGWYNGAELISTEREYPVSNATKNMVLQPVFAPAYRANIVSNGWDVEAKKYIGYFSSGYDQYYYFAEKNSLDTAVLDNEGCTRLIYDIVPIKGVEQNVFIGWMRDDSTVPDTVSDNGTLTTETRLYRDTTFVGFFGPEGSKVVRLLEAEGGSVGKSMNSRQLSVDGTTWNYYYTSDNSMLTAQPDSGNGYMFTGWYLDGSLVSHSTTFNVSTDLPADAPNVFYAGGAVQSV